MESSDESPLVKALPPETDYLTYLTIVEYNLNKEQLPVLHDLLQDTTLTTNIGWDLVKLLLPLLPESEQCLQDIALLGNPRETVLKVAELLEELGQQQASGNTSDEGDGEQDDARSSNSPSISESDAKSSLTLLQFHCLLHMLCVLHPRIQTKYPSRFLVTSIQAVIIAHKNLAHMPASIRPILMFLKSLTGSNRPHLPPRNSQPAIPSVTRSAAALDPERDADTVSEEEAGLTRRILRSYFTHVIECYVEALGTVGGTSPLAWSNRFCEKRFPDKVLPNRKGYRLLFQEQPGLETRDTTISQLLASLPKATHTILLISLQSMAESDMLMPWDDLLQLVTEPEGEHNSRESIFSIQELPVSRTGALYCVVARAAISLLNDRPSPFPLTLFPQHDELVAQFLTLEGTSTWANQLIDAVLLLGWIAYDCNSGVIEADTRAEFSSYLQRMTAVAANVPLADLRFQLHVFASTVLHSNPSTDARLDFIQDTLEHCPYENLKVSAVGWLKDETLEAFDLPVYQSQNGKGLKIVGITNDSSNAFARPLAIRACAPWLFAKPDLSSDDGIAAHLPFWLAVLNFYYLLCSSKLLCEGLDIHGMSLEFDVQKSFVDVLTKLAEPIDPSQNSASEDEIVSDIWVLKDALIRLQQLRGVGNGQDPS